VSRSPRIWRALLAGTVALVVPVALVAPAVGAGTTPTPRPTPTATKPVPPPPYVPKRAPGQPVPAVPAGLPKAIEPYAEYQGQVACTPSAKPGSRKLAALLRTTYGPADIGIDRACSDGGQSEHKEGRALDWMLSYKKAAERAKVEAFLSWITGRDAQGNAGGYARRLGIMYIGWHDRIWKSYAPQNGWTELKGCYSKPSSSDDTYCHRDHAHFTLSWDGAAARTSFWDLTAETRDACPEPWSAGRVQGVTPSTAVHAVTAWALLNTLTGTGTGAGPCRLSADRWSYDGRAIQVKVTGRRGVPSTGVAAVRLRVYLRGANAATKVTVSPTGGTAVRSYRVGTVATSNTVAVAMNRTAVAVVVAPVATNGTVTFKDYYGALDLSVAVTGWFGRAAAPPPPPPTTPPPAPGPAPAPARVPAYPGSPLVPGSKGAAVTAVQKALIARGFKIPSLVAKTVAFGSYGSETLVAVKAYQVKNPALGKADGIIGPKTYAALTAVLLAH
jgi:hypothetical protein